MWKIWNSHTKYINQIILGLGMYSSLAISLSKLNHAMYGEISHMHELNFCLYAACMTEINKYLTFFVGLRQVIKLEKKIKQN